VFASKPPEIAETRLLIFNNAVAQCCNGLRDTFEKVTA
jgi:hypothetical protein